VGDVKISLTTFFELTVHEAILLINNHEKQQEEFYSLMFMATYNSSGAVYGGKKFKIQHPFEKKATKTAATKKQKDETMAFLQNAMKESR
jgi:hypothetical protein